eukprot:11134313-Lingulodinium_polyedra.AAC.1
MPRTRMRRTGRREGTATCSSTSTCRGSRLPSVGTWNCTRSVRARVPRVAAQMAQSETRRCWLRETR